MALTNDIEKLLEEDARRRRYPLAVKLELLPVCNLNCKMCYIRTDMAQVRAAGGLIPADKWIALAQELRAADTLFLLLTGGEVFLYPEFRRLYTALCGMGFGITLNTNATLIDGETVAWLREMPPRLVSISLYGASDATYEALCGQRGMFTRVSRAIDLLLESGIRIELKTMLNPLNEHDAQAMYDFARARGVFYEAAAYAFPPARKAEPAQAFRFTPAQTARCTIDIHRRSATPEQFDRDNAEYLEKYERTKGEAPGEVRGFTCAAANSSCWITWKGEMTPCGLIPTPCTHPFEQGFAAAWASLKAACDGIRMSPACAACDKRQICTVCPAANLAETGRYDCASPFHCEMTAATLEQIRQLAAKRTIMEGEQNPS